MSRASRVPSYDFRIHRRRFPRRPRSNLFYTSPPLHGQNNPRFYSLHLFSIFSFSASPKACGATRSTEDPRRKGVDCESPTLFQSNIKTFLSIDLKFCLRLKRENPSKITLLVSVVPPTSVFRRRCRLPTKVSTIPDFTAEHAENRFAGHGSGTKGTPRDCTPPRIQSHLSRTAVDLAWPWRT